MRTTPRPGSDLPATLPVYILAGGRSRRFGTDKARADLDGAPMIRRIADVLSDIAAVTTVVARDPDAYSDLGFTTIADVVPERGPAAGILTALQHHRATGGGGGWILVSACDWVGIDADWAAQLMARRAQSGHAIVFESDRFEPLFALYHESAVTPLQDRIGRGVVKMQTVLRELTTITLPAPADWQRATNVNRPGDLEG